MPTPETHFYCFVAHEGSLGFKFGRGASDGRTGGIHKALRSRDFRHLSRVEFIKRELNWKHHPKRTHDFIQFFGLKLVSEIK